MTGFMLKLIALVTMIMDHSQAAFTSLPSEFRIIGRMAFPIYVFLVAEGARKTRNIRNYFLRLALFAVISQYPFGVIFGHLNVFCTLALAVFAIWMCQLLAGVLNKAVYRVVCLIIVVAASFFAEWIGTDYGLFGVAVICLVYFCKNKAAQVIALGISFLAHYGGLEYLINNISHIFSEYSGTVFSIWSNAYLNGKGMLRLLCVLLSVLLVAFYNGKRGPSRRIEWKEWE